MYFVIKNYCDCFSILIAYTVNNKSLTGDILTK